MIHLKGVEKLLQLAGPEQYSTGPSYQLFMGIRPLLVSKHEHQYRIKNTGNNVSDLWMLRI